MTRAETLSLAGPVGPLETRLEFPDSDAAPAVFGVVSRRHRIDSHAAHGIEDLPMGRCVVVRVAAALRVIGHLTPPGHPKYTPIGHIAITR